jgi:hypothetical protein
MAVLDMLCSYPGYAGWICSCYLLRWLCWISFLPMLALQNISARYVSWHFYAGRLTLFLRMLAGYDGYAS